MEITHQLSAIDRLNYHDLNETTGRRNFKKCYDSEKVVPYGDRGGAVGKIKEKCRVLSASTQKPDELFYIALMLYDRFVETDIAVNTNAFMSNCVAIAFESVHKGRETSRFLEVFAEGSDNAEYTQAEQKVSKEIADTMRESLKSEKIVSPFEFIEFVRSLVHISDSDDIAQVKELIVISREDADFAKFRPSVIAASAVLALTSNLYKHSLEGFKSELLTLPFFDGQEITECQEQMEILYELLHVKGDRLGCCGELMKLKASACDIL